MILIEWKYDINVYYSQAEVHQGNQDLHNLEMMKKVKTDYLPPPFQPLSSSSSPSSNMIDGLDSLLLFFFHIKNYGYISLLKLSLGISIPNVPVIFKVRRMNQDLPRGSLLTPVVLLLLQLLLSFAQMRVTQKLGSKEK